VTKHTPGPFEIGRFSQDGANVTGFLGVSVAWFGCNTTFKVTGESHRIEPEEARANACLFAASPDLLRAAEKAADFLRSSESQASKAVVAALEAAIRKANP
jgi:hypothetical protein